MSDRISQAPPDRLSMDYAALRERGIELIRQYAGESWTDHNIHDPGITLLEAFCYAMTELGFRIQQSMPDLLSSGTAYGSPNLVPAHRVLPTAPVTTEDFQKVLLDHPLIKDAQVSLNAASTVSFYKRPEDDLQTNEPSFTYEVTDQKVSLNGLYDVLVVFQDATLNSNVYIQPITVSIDENVDGETDTHSYTVEIALPYWDEPEAIEFQAATANIDVEDLGDILTDVVMQQPPGTDVWRALDEPQSYFGQLAITFNNGNNLTLWIVLRIIDDLDQPATEALSILSTVEESLASTTEGSLMLQFMQRVQAAHQGALQIQQYIESWRNLGEVPVQLQVARQQEIGIHARIEVTGSTNLEQLLANIFIAVDTALSPKLTFSSLEAILQKGATPETLYNGPLLRHGFLATTAIETLARSGTLYTSDVLRLIMQLRSSTRTDVVAQENPTGRDILAVTDLALSNFVNNRPITTNARDCLTLVDIQRYRPRLSLTKSRITFIRNDLEVPYDLGWVAELIEQIQMPPEQSTQQSFMHEWPVTVGERLPIDDYFPFQNDLPRLYRVGEHGNPEPAGKLEQVRSLQTKGYLLLFEQFLADLTTQLGHINNFFSSDSDERTTYFTRALFDIIGTEHLLKGFPRDSEEPWQSYIVAPDNPYQQALQTAAETPNQFLDRRHRMLDHLLARQGEDMVTWAQEFHRWGQKKLTEELDPLLEILRETEENPMPLTNTVLAAMETRQQAVNRQLIQDKAAFLADIPALNTNKLQAWGKILQHFPEVLDIVQGTEGFHWQLVIASEPRLRSAIAFKTRIEAIFAAEFAIELAAQTTLYSVVSVDGGLHRYQLTNTPNTPDAMSPTIVGESIETWNTDVLATDAANSTATAFANLRMASSLTTMERRIAHLTGIRRQQRQALLQPIENYFQIYDENNDGTRRWHLWSEPDYSGEILLSSASHFTGADEAEAIEMAQGSIQQVIQYGLDEWNYHIPTAEESTVSFELRHPDFVLREANDYQLLGIYDSSLVSPTDIQSTIRTTVAQLYTKYSVEGFHLVEHILLRPHLSGKGYDLDLLSLNSSDDIPEEDQSQVIVARIDGSYHVRIFDEMATIIIDKGNGDFLPDEILLQDLDDAFDNQPLNNQTRSKLLQRVSASAGYIVADYFLQLPSDQSQTGWEQDPYNHQLSLIFPSGFGRDFTTETNESIDPEYILPHRFRDREFRRHVERVVQQSCPAHLRPHIYWVDRQDPEQSVSSSPLTPEATDISFDQFEAIYFTWLNTQLLPGISVNEQAIARNQMILAMNALPSPSLPL